MKQHSPQGLYHLTVGQSVLCVKLSRLRYIGQTSFLRILWTRKRFEEKTIFFQFNFIKQHLIALPPTFSLPLDHTSYIPRCHIICGNIMKHQLKNLLLDGPYSLIKIGHCRSCCFSCF